MGGRARARPVCKVDKSGCDDWQTADCWTDKESPCSGLASRCLGIFLLWTSLSPSLSHKRPRLCLLITTRLGSGPNRWVPHKLSHWSLTQARCLSCGKAFMEWGRHTDRSASRRCVCSRRRWGDGVVFPARPPRSSRVGLSPVPIFPTGLQAACVHVSEREAPCGECAAEQRLRLTSEGVDGTR